MSACNRSKLAESPAMPFSDRTLSSMRPSTRGDSLHSAASRRLSGALEHVAVLIAEDGQQNLAAQFLAQRLPFDVEIFGIARCGAVLEHVEPPAIVGLEHAHVIGHDVDHQAHSMTLELVRERVEIL